MVSVGGVEDKKSEKRKTFSEETSVKTEYRYCGLTAGPRTGGEVGEGGGRKAWANEG